MRTLSQLGSGLLVLALFPASVGAQTTALPAVGDTYLRSGSPNQNQGSQSLLTVQSSGQNRSLVQFDQAAIAAAVGTGSLASASLELFIEDNGNNWGSAGRTVDAHRLSEAWTEGGATWNCPVDTNPGNSSPNCPAQWAGGTFAEEPSDTVLHTNGLAGWVRFDVTADVLDFLAGAPNQGWLVKKTEEGQNGRVDYTSRQGAAAQRPQLVLVVESPSFDQVPPSLAITSPATLLVNDTTPAIEVEYQDGGAGVDLSSLVVAVDGIEITAACTAGAASATCEPPPLAAGSHSVTAQVEDLAGNPAMASRGFELLLGPGLASTSVGAVADTYLRLGSPNQNQGTESLLRLRQSGKNRALLRFDVAAIATAIGEGTLQSAHLVLTISHNGSNWGAAGRTIDLHRLTAAWTEGGATWNCADDTNPTNQQPNCSPQWGGGTFAPAATGSVLVTNDLAGSIDLDVTADVAALLTGTPNHGWLVKKSDEGKSGLIEFGSRESAAVPRLVLTFDLPAGGDQTAPTVAFIAPAGPLVINDSTPEVVVEYGDGQSGIDPASLRVRSGSLDFTVTCALGAGSATCTPPPLGAGERLLIAEVSDLAGNGATASRAIEILIDAQPPSLEIAAPAAPVIVSVSPPGIEVLYGDGDSGVDLGALHVLLDGSDLTAGCSVTATSASCPPSLLSEGVHTLTAQIADRVGLTATASRDFTLDLDAVPPTLTLVAPAAPTVHLAGPSLEVEVAYADADVGIEVSSFALLLADEDRSDACDLLLDRAVCTLELAAGSHALQASVRDRAGNPSSLPFSLVVLLDPTAPTLTILSPDQPSYLADPPAIALEYSDAGSGLDLGRVRLRIDSADLTATCSVGASGATCPPPALAEGAHTLVAEVADLAGNRVQSSRNFELELLDRTPPTLTLLAPQGGVLLSGGVPRIEVSYQDASGIDLASLFVALDEAEVTASCQVEAAQAVCQPAALPAGEHLLRVELRDLEGNLATLAETFSLELQLPIRVTEPASGTLTAGVTVDVRGTVSTAADAVSVGGVAAVLEGGTFLATGVPLREGANVLSAVASSAAGGLGTDTVTVVRDTLRPQVVVFSPRDGLVTHAQQILVSGEVNDPASSSSAQTPPVVRVGGVEAAVEQRSFVVPDFLLQPGENLLQVEAVDSAGNVGSAEVRVTYVPGAAQRIEEILGNGQTGRVGAELAEPLVVRLVGFAGQPLAGRRVRFAVTRGNGQVRSFPAAGASLEVITDANGIAQASFVLGERSGRGNHEVTATSLGVQGEVAFCASAEPGGPRRIKRIVGNNMTGAPVAIADAEAPYPLLTQVFDDFGNPVAGVEVTYTVLAGGGHFGGQPSYLTQTDSWGKASATLTLGPLPGINNNLAEATVAGISETGALFNFTAVSPREGDTSLSGLVLDNQDAPVPGVTLQIGDRSAVADQEGRFTLTGLPVGTVHLGVDGSTATRPGRWPHLGFEFTLVRGIDNSLGMPIRLLPIDVASGRIVGGAEDVKVPMSGVPGAELTVFASSVTFLDGSRVGEVTFTQVHGDKVPMVAPMGSDFMLAFTIQPPGTVFDPPARIAIPNLGGRPGSVVDMFSFDHDLGEFITAGTAMISADGRQLVSTPGSGISKAGWGGCVAPPPPDSDVCNPSACTVCPAGATQPEPKCGSCDSCNGGTCEPRTVDSVMVKANGESEDEVVVGKEQEIDFTAEAEATCNLTYAWDFGDGETAQGPAPKHEYQEVGSYTVQLEVSCNGCADNGSQTDELRIRVIEVDLEIKDLPEETEPTPNEEEPGATLVVNGDDDNESDMPDVDETGVTDEDDLAELKLNVDDQLDSGKLRLDAPTGGDKVKVWEEQEKSTRLELPKTWDLDEGAQVPDSVWVEGVEGSSRGGVELKLSYEAETVREPIEDKVVLSVVDVHFDVLPTEVEGVSADEAELEVVAAVFYPDPLDPEKLLPVEDGAEVVWEVVEGGGSVSPSSSTTENGLASTTLSTSTVPGSSYVVEGKLQRFRLRDAPEEEEVEVDLRSESAQLVVVPGVPASIQLVGSSAQQTADGTGLVSFEVAITDRSGNPVEDGTPVTWLLDESTSDYRATVTETAGGAASAELPAPLVDGEQVVTVLAGTAQATNSISISPVVGTLTAGAAELDVLAGASTQMTATVNAADGTPVYWTTSNGNLVGDATVTGGLATATLSTAGGSTGPVVVTATIGQRLLFWQGTFIVEDQVSLVPATRFLVAEATEDSVTTVTWADGSVHEIPIIATTQVEVRGPANGLARVAFAGTVTLEAYNFESESGGQVPGLLRGLDMSLAGASLATDQARTGAASLRFEPGDQATIADHPDLDLTADLGVSLSLRPSQLAATALIGKGNAWSLELLASGQVRATVGTSTGPVVLTSAATVAVGTWSSIGLEAVSPSILLFVNGAVATTTFTGPLVTNDAAISLGGQLDAHLDDLALFDAGTSVPLRCVGLDAAGLIQLDGSGRASFQVVSTGAPVPADLIAVPHHLGVESVGAPTASLRSGSLRRLAQKQTTGGYGCYLMYRLRAALWEPTVDTVLAFFGGDPHSNAATAANVAGGVLIVGDIGSIVKNLWRMAGKSEVEPNYPELVLSSLGLLTEFAVGAGEIADVPISIARALVARIGNSPLAHIMVKQIRKAILSGQAYALSKVNLLRALVDNNGARSLFNALIKSEDVFEAAARAHARLGDLFTHNLPQVLGGFSEDVGKKVLLTLGDVSDDVITSIKDPAKFNAAIDGLARTLQAGIDPQLIKRVLENNNILGATYRQAELLQDLARVDQVPGFDRLVNALKISNVQAKGFRYELEVAVSLGGNGAVTVLGRAAQIPGIFPPRFTDIDVLANGIAYQAKRSAAAVGSGKAGLESAQKWVKSVLPQVGNDPARVKYAIPHGVDVPAQVQAFLDSFTPKIDVVRIAHAKTLAEARRLWQESAGIPDGMP